MNEGRSSLAISSADVPALLEQAGLRLLADDPGRGARFIFEALERSPDSWEALGALSSLLIRLGRYNLAEAVLREAMASQPRNAGLRYNLSLVLLIQRRFAEAWSMIDSHWVWQRLKGEPPTSTASLQRWNPTVSPAARTLVWTTGLTEPLLLLALVDEFRSRSGSVVLAVPERLVKLVARSLPGVEVHPSSLDLGPLARDLGLTHHLPMLVLGALLRRSIASFKDNGVRARPDLAAVARLKARHHREGGPLVGLAWKTRNDHAAHKSIALAQLLDALPHGARAISLQYGDIGSDLAALAPTQRARLIVDPEIDPLGDFDPYAALVASCDAVIATSGLHSLLAGRLGTPTVLLAPIGFASAWYWHEGDGPNLWFPRLQVMHQRRRKDWDDVVVRSRPALASALV